MENTSYNKQKFFALYWGQKIVADGFCLGDTCTVDFALSEGIVKEGWLELKPLSEISDEDAIEVAKIVSFHDGVGVLVFNQKDRVSIYDKYNDCPHMINVLHIFYSLEIFSLDEEGKVFQYDWDRLIKCTDYLRSKGYYLGDGTEVEYGWVKLTPNK